MYSQYDAKYESRGRSRKAFAFRWHQPRTVISSAVLTGNGLEPGEQVTVMRHSALHAVRCRPCLMRHTCDMRDSSCKLQVTRHLSLPYIIYSTVYAATSRDTYVTCMEVYAFSVRVCVSGCYSTQLVWSHKGVGASESLRTY